MKTTLVIAMGLIGGVGVTLGVQPGADAGKPLGEQLAERYKQSMTEGGMQRWMESMRPELAHEFLAEKFVGTWKSDVTISGMGADQTAHWTNESSMILGGRIVEQRVKGTMMGMPAEGLTLIGYDNARRLFHMTMYSSMDTGVRTLWGNLDQTGTVLTFVGEMDEVMSGEFGKSFMLVYTFNDDGSYDYQIKEILYGEAFSVIRVHAEREG